MALLEHTPQTLERADCVHTPCYCEENVYLLVTRLAKAGLAAADLSDLYVVFVSNERKQVLMWLQQAGSGDDGMCIWDYHVLLVQKRTEFEGGSLVWDLDTTLPFPVSFSIYHEEAFRPDILLLTAFERLFRMVPASLYLQHFSSDRSHMRRQDGSWMAPPPAYRPILKSEGVARLLSEYMTISQADHYEKESKEIKVGPALGTKGFGPRRPLKQKSQPLGIVCTEELFLDCFL